MTLADVVYGCSSKREEQGQVPGAPGSLDRSSLPNKEPVRKTPKDAPNELIVLIDDMGFGVSGSFGGPVNMLNSLKIVFAITDFTQRPSVHQIVQLYENDWPRRYNVTTKRPTFHTPE